MSRHIIFATRAEAEAHARALASSVAYTYGGRPPLPRCDGGQWGDPEVRQGARCTTPDPCTVRSEPHPDCPYATRAAVEPERLPGGAWAVRVTEAHAAAKIDTSKARRLTTADLRTAVRTGP